jgi:dolichol-phosphate mannosyltransferase
MIATPDNQLINFAPAAAANRLTVICPVHNEEKTVPLFVPRMDAVIKRLASDYKVEVVFTNNASTDSTLETIFALRKQYPWIHVISLSKNGGYHKSLECGIRHAQGDIFAFIDVDCEDPPEMLEDFIKYYEQGFDVVYGKRENRQEPAAINALRKLFYRVLRALADHEIFLDMAEFSLFSGEVRRAIIQDRSAFPFFRAAIARVGFRSKAIPYTRSERIAGESHYNLISMTRFAIDGILASSTLPLRLPVFVLPYWLVGLVLLAFWSALAPNPWISALQSVWSSGYIGISLAFASFYVARIYKNSLGRPNFFVDTRNSIFQATSGSAATDQRTGFDPISVDTLSVDFPVRTTPIGEATGSGDLCLSGSSNR